MPTPLYTYSGKPGASVRDAVRFEIQDTDPDTREAWLLRDAEIDYAISEEASSSPTEGEVLSAAARCLEVLARRFAAQADIEVGAIRAQYARLADNYDKQAKELRARAIHAHAPWAGGVSHSDKDRLANNLDRVQPAFAHGMFDSPFTGPSDAPIEGGA